MLWWSWVTAGLSPAITTTEVGGGHGLTVEVGLDNLLSRAVLGGIV
jgi:hypothetical protein